VGVDFVQPAARTRIATIAHRRHATNPMLRRGAGVRDGQMASPAVRRARATCSSR
jgi:hypothetical protein